MAVVRWACWCRIVAFSQNVRSALIATTGQSESSNTLGKASAAYGRIEYRADGTQAASGPISSLISGRSAGRSKVSRISDFDHLRLAGRHHRPEPWHRPQQARHMGAELMLDAFGRAAIDVPVESVLLGVRRLPLPRVPTSRPIAQQFPVQNQVDIFGEPLDQAPFPHFWLLISRDIAALPG